MRTVEHQGKVYGRSEELEHINLLLEQWQFDKQGTDHEFMVKYLDRNRNNDPEWLQKLNCYCGTDKQEQFFKEESIYHDENGKWIERD